MSITDQFCFLCNSVLNNMIYVFLFSSRTFWKLTVLEGLDDRLFLILWNFVTISVQHTACKSRCNRWSITVAIRALCRCKASAEHTGSKEGKWLQQQQLPTWAKRFITLVVNRLRVRFDLSGTKAPVPETSSWLQLSWFQSYKDETSLLISL